MSTKKNTTEVKKSDADRIEDGELLCRVIIEMLGAPKDHIENTMKSYVDNLSHDEKLTIVEVHIAEAEAQDSGKLAKIAPSTPKELFSTYAEIELWFSSSEKLIEFCFDSLPSSIEIIEPQEMLFTASKFAGLLNDLQAKLHKVDMELKLKNADLQVISHSVRTVIINFIMYCLTEKPQNAEYIAKAIGIKLDKIENVLTELVDKKIILKNNDLYSKQ